MDQDALADEAISGWNNSFTTIKSMHVIDSRRRRQRVSRVIHMSARVRTDVGSRPTNRQILWKYCYLREHVCCRASSHRGNARGGPSPARFAGMRLAENASGRDPEDLLSLPGRRSGRRRDAACRRRLSVRNEWATVRDCITAWYRILERIYRSCTHNIRAPKNTHIGFN